MSARRIGVAAAVATMLAGLVAYADISISKQVQKTFRGQIIISAQELPDGEGDPKATIATYKKLDLHAVKGDVSGDDVASWTFHYTAFLKAAPGTKSVSFDFHTADKENLYVANKTLQVDPKATMFTGALTIDENEGPTRGKTYHVILRAKKGSKEIELARTKLTLK